MTLNPVRTVQTVFPYISLYPFHIFQAKYKEMRDKSRFLQHNTTVYLNNVILYIIILIFTLHTEAEVVNYTEVKMTTDMCT